MNKTILIIDDFKMVRNFLEMTLKMQGYQILTAPGGKEALETLKRGRQVDLVISDYNMPNMTGQQLLEAIKKENEFHNLPVIFLTSEKDPEKKLKAKNSGLTAWVQKPYKLEPFLNQIRHAINKEI